MTKGKPISNKQYTIQEKIVLNFKLWFCVFSFSFLAKKREYYASINQSNDRNLNKLIADN